MRQIFLFVFCVCAAMGCGRGSAKFSDKDLPGKWELDYQELANQIMGPKMGPNFYTETFSRLSLALEFKAGGELVMTSSSSTATPGTSPMGNQTPGTWKVANPGKHPLKVNIAFKDRSEDVVIEFVDGNTIHMLGPPKFLNMPKDTTYIQFTRRP